MTGRDQHIREIAYFLWLEEGSPEGEADRHWRTAEGLVAEAPLEDRPIDGESPEEPKRASRR